MYGNTVSQGVAGLPAGVIASQNLYLGHFATDPVTWYTGVAILNPSDITQASVDMTAYDNNGNTLGTAHVDVPPNGRVCDFVRNLFNDPSLGSGWIEVVSDVDVMGFLVYGMWAGGIAALPSQDLAEQLVLGHFAVDSMWWTGLAVLNPSGSDVNVTLTAYGDTSGQIDQQSFQIPAKSKIVDYAEVLLPGIATAADTTGWIMVEADPGQQVASGLVFGDKVSDPNKIAGAPAIPSGMTLNLSSFRSETDWTWWTGVTLVNPGTATNVTLTAYGSDGTQIDQIVQPIEAQGKTWGFVRTLFSLGANTRGWIEAAADDPVSALQLFSADDDAEEAWGLAAIAPQSADYTIYLGHYASTVDWWTVFGMANTSGVNPANVYLTAYTDGGVVAGTSTDTLPVKGSISDLIQNFFN
jgi:hypothetical protein